MKLNFQYGSGVLNLPSKVVDKLSSASEKELKVLLKLASCGSGSEIVPAVLATELGIDEAAFMGAISFWRGVGVMQIDAQTTDGVAEQTSADTPAATAQPTATGVQVNARTGKDGRLVTTVQSDDMPHYTGEEIKRIFAENVQLSGMIDECQKIVGKLFNPTEINKLLTLTDYYRLEPEYIVTLCYHCHKIGKSSIPYLDKTAKSLWQEGIVTIDALEERMAIVSKATDLSGVYRQLSGAGKRSFTEREMKFFTQWSKWEITPELLKLAYEVTVDNTGSPSMPYLNKVLSNWQEAGYRTPEEVAAAMEAYKQKKEAKAGGAVGSFDTDEFFDAALARSLELHMKQTEPKG